MRAMPAERWDVLVRIRREHLGIFLRRKPEFVRLGMSVRQLHRESLPRIDVPIETSVSHESIGRVYRQRRDSPLHRRGDALRVVVVKQPYNRM